MPLNAGDAGYGSVSGPGLSGAAGGSETAPLLIAVPEPQPLRQWQPLTKEQLEVAAGGPRWRRLRCYLVLLFWLAWLAMLATSVAIIATSPRPVVTPLEWWQKTLLYELPPAAFRAEEGPGGIDGEAIDDGMIIHNMNVYLNDLCTAPVEAHAHVCHNMSDSQPGRSL